MDSDRFDRLARGLAIGIRRRAAIKGIAGAGLAAFAAALRRGTAEARPNSIPLGGACYHDRQCINDYFAPRGGGLNPDLQIVYCADNGATWDGPANCCRYDGGACEVAEDCCGYRGCHRGFCSF